MANPFYIPQKQRPNIIDYLNIALQGANLYQRGRAQSAEEKYRDQLLNLRGQEMDISKQRLGLEGRRIGVAERSASAAEEANVLSRAKIPTYQRPFREGDITQKMVKFYGMFKDEGVRKGASRAFSGFETYMRELTKSGKPSTFMEAYRYSVPGIEAYQGDIQENLKKEYEKIPPARIFDKDRQNLKNMMDMFSGSPQQIADRLFYDTKKSYEIDDMLKFKQSMEGLPDSVKLTMMADKMEQAGKTNYANQLRMQGQAMARKETYIAPTAGQQAPSGTREFELYQFGKEVPGSRGTPEYQRLNMDYMKKKASLTSAANRAQPKVLRQEFINQSKDFVKVRDSYNRIKASAKDPSPAGDLSMIFNYMKMLDPGSVVRESEFATAANTGSVPQRVWAQYNRVLSGERLSDKMRDDFKNRSDQLYRQQEMSHKKLKSEYTRLSKGMGIEPANVIIDYITEQKKIENKQYDKNAIYEDAQGRKMKFLGMDSSGEELWEPVR